MEKLDCSVVHSPARGRLRVPGLGSCLFLVVVSIGFALLGGVRWPFAGAIETASCSTPLSVQGELRLSVKAFLTRVLAAARAGDRVRAWVAGPVARELLSARCPEVVSVFELAERDPARIGREVRRAEADLADDVAAVGEPLLSLLLQVCSDRRVAPDARCVVMRTMALRWPERLAVSLSIILTDEPTGFPVWEAAVVAGRISHRLPLPGLVPHLKACVARLRGWGRQYPIDALNRLGDSTGVEVVLAALSDQEGAVRRHASSYLARTHDRALRGPL